MSRDLLLKQSSERNWEFSTPHNLHPMANSPTHQPPIAPNQPPPPNFNFIECPNEVVNVRKPLIRNPSQQPNEYKYMYFTCYNQKIYVKNSTLQKIFLDPASPWPDPLKMLMIEGIDGSVRPAHLPSFLDLVRLPTAARCMLRHLMEKLNESEDDDSPIFPFSRSDFVDPEPILREYGRIFLLRSRKCVIVSAINTDQIDIFHVMDRITYIHLSMWSRFVSNKKVGKTFTNIHRLICDRMTMVIPTHNPIVVWSVRGVNRLGFLSRFKQMVATHNPAIIVLMETRSFKNQFKLVFRDLECKYNWVCSDSSGLKGGFIVMWDGTLLNLISKEIATSHGPPLTCVLKMKDQENSNAGRVLFNNNN